MRTPQLVFIGACVCVCADSTRASACVPGSVGPGARFLQDVALHVPRGAPPEPGLIAPRYARLLMLMLLMLLMLMLVAPERKPTGGGQ